MCVYINLYIETERQRDRKREIYYNELVHKIMESY